MMEDTKTGMGWGGILLIFVVIWILFGAFNGGGFGGWGNNCNNRCGNGCENGLDTIALLNAMNGNSGCNRVSNCEIERQEIIDSATTQYKIEQQGAATRATVVESGNAIQEQANRIYIQGIQAELFDAKATINKLQSEAFTRDLFGQLSAQTSDSFCALNRRLDAIECNTPKRPPLYALSATGCGQLVPAGSCGCGNI